MGDTGAILPALPLSFRQRDGGDFNDADDDLAISPILNALVLFNPVVDNSVSRIGGYMFAAPQGRKVQRYKDFNRRALRAAHI